MVIPNTHKKCLQMGDHVTSMKNRKSESGYTKSQNRQLMKMYLLPFGFCLPPELDFRVSFIKAQGGCHHSNTALLCTLSPQVRDQLVLVLPRTLLVLVLKILHPKLLVISYGNCGRQNNESP